MSLKAQIERFKTADFVQNVVKTRDRVILNKRWNQVIQIHVQSLTRCACTSRSGVKVTFE
jgi:hypothetical protein